MIDSWAAAEAYRRNYGEPGLEGGEFNSLSRAACEEISPLVKEGADTGDIRLLNLAAATVRCVIVCRECEKDGALVSFRAGDVAVNTDYSAAVKRALDEKKRRYEAAVPLLCDRGFCFMQVKV